MAYNIYDVGPVKYQQEQQGRRDDWMRQMLNMFMMSKQMGLKREEFEEQQRQFQALEPQRQARTQYWQAQAQPKPPPLPPDIAEYLMLIQLGFPKEEAKKLTYNIKPEQKSQLWIKAKERYELQLSPTLQDAYKDVLAEERVTKTLTPYQKTRLTREETTDFQKMLERGMDKYEKRIKELEKGTLDLATKSLKETDPKIINNLRTGLDTLQQIDAKATGKEATQIDKALAYQIYGQSSRVEKEGAFWEKPDIKDLQIPEFVRRLLEEKPNMTIEEAILQYQLWKNKKK